MKRETEPRNSNLTKADLLPADVICPAGQFTMLGSYTVKAGMGVAIGQGEFASQGDATGRLFVDLKDAALSPGVDIDGLIRIEARDPQDRPVETIVEDRTDNTRLGVTALSERTVLYEHNTIATEDRKYALLFRPDTTAFVGSANSKINVAVTTYTMREDGLEA